MRLWHSKLIPLLDGKRLCDLHMSCCNLRGNGWGKKNKNINYIYDDPLGEDALVVYHHKVLLEMDKRDYDFDTPWLDVQYCGKKRPPREFNRENYIKAHLRDIPLLGHTLEFYTNDVHALRERGLDIDVKTYEIFKGDALYTQFVATLGNKSTDYTIKTNIIMR